MVAMRVQVDRALAGIKDAQQHAIAGGDVNRGIAQREREGAAVEQKDVWTALRDVVIAMHRPLDLHRVLVEGGYAMQPVVDVLVDQRVLARITLLPLRRGEVRNASGADDKMAEIVVRAVRFDDQHASESHEDMHIGLHVAVIEEGPRVLRHELVGERLPGHDGGLGDVRYTIHGVRVNGAVQVDRVRKVVRVLQNDLDVVALFHPDSGARRTRQGDHTVARWREYPEGNEFAGIDFLLNFVDFQADSDLIGVAVTVEITPEHHCVGCGTRNDLATHGPAIGAAGRQARCAILLTHAWLGAEGARHQRA